MFVKSEKFESALRAGSDFSGGFSARMEQLRALMTSQVGVPFTLEKDVMYSSSWQLVALLDSKGNPAPAAKAADAKFVIYASSKGPFALVLFQRLVVLSDARARELQLPGAGRYCLTQEPDKTESVYRSLKARMEAELQRTGLTVVDGDVLNEPVEGVATELDGLPATVREVLFGEMI